MYFAGTAMPIELETKAELVTTQEPILQYLSELGVISCVDFVGSGLAS